MGKCLESSCERDAKVRGYCQAHYNRAARRGLIEKRPKRMALCHPDRRHYAYDYCRTCYLKNKPAIPKERPPADRQEGLVRIPVPGWGCMTVESSQQNFPGLTTITTPGVERVLA